MSSPQTSEKLQVPFFQPGELAAGRYRLLEYLTREWSGMSWVAADLVEKGQVTAIVLPKMFSKEGFEEDLRKRGARLNTESPAAFLRFRDAVPHAGAMLYVTELARGATLNELRSRYEHGVFEPRDLGSIGVELCESLAQIHNAGRAHGDLHPGQILKDLRSQTRITAIGIAGMVNHFPFPRDGRHAMSYACKSQQQREGAGAVPTDDIYALGAILFHLLTAQLLTSPALESIAGRNSIPPIEEVRKYFGIPVKPMPPQWNDLIRRCVSVEPSERPEISEIHACLAQSTAPVAINRGDLLHGMPRADSRARSSGGVKPESSSGQGTAVPPRIAEPRRRESAQAGAAEDGIVTQEGMVVYSRKSRVPRFHLDKKILFYAVSTVSLVLFSTLAWLLFARDTKTKPSEEQEAKVVGTIQNSNSQDLPDTPEQTPSSTPKKGKLQKDGDEKKTPRKKTPAPTQEVAANTNPTTPAPKDEIAPPTPGFHTGPSTESSTHGAPPAPKVDGDKARIESGANSHFEHLGSDTPDSPMALAKASTPAVAAVATPRAVVSFAQTLSAAELDHIGKRVWKNECDGTIQGLTSWNGGENFASLGIGHFIWYPEGVHGPYEESFPPLVKFLERNAVHLPEWLAKAKVCPWKNRADFMAAKGTQQMIELRDLLATTLHLQCEFLAERLAKTARTLGGELEAPKQQHVRAQYALLAQSGAGTFALIDYVNFKGEGTNPNERYKGQGWGLLQVLEMMDARNAEDAPREFGEAAVRVLARRVANAPKKEDQWLQGWTNRVRAY